MQARKRSEAMILRPAAIEKQQTGPVSNMPLQ